MNRQEFEDYWFNQDGADEAFENYAHLITEAEIRRQPSWKITKCRANAITEAVWQRSFNEKVLHDALIIVAEADVNLLSYKGQTLWNQLAAQASKS